MLPSNPKDLKKIDAALQEISNSKTRIEAERELIKEITDNINEEHDIPKKLINQLAKVYHMRNFADEVSQQEEFQVAFEQLASNNTNLLPKAPK
jgi:hypothetical protein